MQHRSHPHPIIQPTGFTAKPSTFLTWGQSLYHRLPGLLLAGGIACASLLMGHLDWSREHGLGPLTLAIVLGMLVGNTLYPRLGASVGAGVAFSKNELLRLGIILYGLRVTFQDIGHIGWQGAAVDIVMLVSTFGLAYWLGTRFFGLDARLAILIGAGSSICGAAAVMATAPVARARAEHVAVAVATVVTFGTVGMFLYPALYRCATQWAGLAWTQDAFGIFAGSTIHEVAQAVAAGRAVGEQAAASAVIEKMVRVMLLAPFLMALSTWLSWSGPGEDSDPSGASDTRHRIAIPWFALGFVMVAGLNSVAHTPAGLVTKALELDDVCLAMAMAGLGLSTHVSAIRKAGIHALALAALLFAWLVLGGLFVNWLL